MQRVYSGGVKINKHEKQYYTHGIIIIINFFFQIFTMKRFRYPAIILYLSLNKIYEQNIIEPAMAFSVVNSCIRLGFRGQLLQNTVPKVVA